MNMIHRGTERGHANHGWLAPPRTAFPLPITSTRNASNSGRCASSMKIGWHRVPGFGTHAHRDMEIISYVLSGELEHRGIRLETAPRSARATCNA